MQHTGFHFYPFSCLLTIYLSSLTHVTRRLYILRTEKRKTAIRWDDDDEKHIGKRVKEPSAMVGRGRGGRGGERRRLEGDMYDRHGLKVHGE